MEEIAAIQTYVSEAIAAVNNGGTLDETTVANLESILRLVELMDSIGIGENVTAGIWQGMEEAGAEASAETVAGNIENTLKAALGISSPSERMKPLGAYTAEGVGIGMSETDLSPYASSMAHGLESTLRSQLRAVGINAMGGHREGINSGTASVVAAMRSAARRAVLAAKSELKIASPSKVFRDEIGVMTMKGLGEGVLKESRAQAAIIRNALRYLTGEAKQGSIVPVNTDNRKELSQNKVNII